MIKAVIFDMDGLLIDSEPFWSRAFKDAFKTVGVTISDEDMLEVRGFRHPESIKHLYNKYHAKGASEADILALTFDDMVAMIKGEGKLLPGVHHSFEVCKKAKLPMAIASSSASEIISTAVDSLAIREFFDQIHSAEYEPYGKPHPGIFITTAGLLGVEPNECLVFEDAPAGVLAAKAAKMKCIAVPEAGLEDNSFIKIADIVIDSLEEFDAAMLASL